MAAARFWHDVIQRQLSRRVDAPTILTGVVVTQENILTRETLALEGDVNVLGQANDGWHRNRGPRRMKQAVVTLFGPGDTLQDEDDCASRRADIDRLVSRI